MAGGRWLNAGKALAGYLGDSGRNLPKNIHALKRRESLVLNMVLGSLLSGRAPALEEVRTSSRSS